jgi:hypothetical protein
MRNCPKSVWLREREDYVPKHYDEANELPRSKLRGIRKARRKLLTVFRNQLDAARLWGINRSDLK